MMIRFTYDDGQESAVVTWTPEYGFVAAGNGALLDAITYEEVKPRLPEVIPAKVVEQMVGQGPLEPDLGDDDDLGDDGTKRPAKCFACDHPWHEEECDRLTEGIPCGCSTAVA